LYQFNTGFAPIDCEESTGKEIIGVGSMAKLFCKKPRKNKTKVNLFIMQHLRL
jgi:hypothetical protein